jgi:hypothetical protein
MTLISLPSDLVNQFFNLEQGKRISKYCKKCRNYTEQVVVSYSDLPALYSGEFQRMVGRIMDVFPGPGLLIGRPSVCRCRTLNR